MRKLGGLVAGLLAGVSPVAAWAQAQPPAPGAAPAQNQAPPTAADQEAPADEMSEDIVVTGELRGAVKTDIKPEVQLGPADIQAYGASNIGELLTALSAQLGSGTGRGGEQPVILLSGRRSTMNEINSLPPEAVERIDILPEEVALQYGYSASQKVINFVLRNRFQSLATVIEGRVPTEGGNSGQSGELGLTKIRRDGRFEFNLNYDHSSSLLESERGVSRAGASVTEAGVPDAAASGAQGLGAFAANANTPNVTDLTPYRTLLSPQKKLVMKGVYSHTLSPHVTATGNLQLTANESESLLGLSSVDLLLRTGNPYSPFSQDVRLLRYLDNISPLRRSSSSQALQGEVSINGDQAPWSKDWNWSFQGSYNRATSETLTDTGIDPVAMQALLDAHDPGFNPFAPIPVSAMTVRPSDVADTTTSLGNVDFLTNGPLFAVPAGKLNASIRVRGRTSDLSSTAFRRGVTTTGDIARDSASVRGNLNLPVASRRYAVLDAIGDLSLNANFEVEQLSDFGRLTTTGYGFNWSPVPMLQARVNWTRDSNAPSAQQLGNPVITTPNVSVYDFVRGESVLVTSITGGNPLLRADNRHVFNVGLNIKPLAETNLNILANYTNQRFRNTSQNFPGPTAEIEAAFPDRFARDADGQLVSVDYRPINLERYEHKEIRWGFSLSLPIASPQAKRLQARRDAFRKAREESQRTGQPLPPEFAAQLQQFRRIGQQGSLFGSPNQRGQGQGQRQGQGQDGQAQPRGDGQGEGQGGGRRFGGGGGGGGFGGGRGGFGGRGGGGNRLFLNAFHTWVLKDQTLIRAGLPVLDQLNGAPSGNGGGGMPAHKVQVQLGVKRDMLSFRLDGAWQSATHVSTGALDSGDRLDFGSLATLNLQAEANFGQNVDLLLKHPWLRNSRLIFRVDNVFNTRQRVTDQDGVTPPAYAPGLNNDALGRVVRISFRKLFS